MGVDGGLESVFSGIHAISHPHCALLVPEDATLTPCTIGYSAEFYLKKLKKTQRAQFVVLNKYQVIALIFAIKVTF